MRVDVGTCATILSDATDCDDQVQWVAPIAYVYLIGQA